MTWTLDKVVNLGQTGLVAADVLRVAFQQADGTLAWKDYTHATANVTLREVGSSGWYHFAHTQQADADADGALVFYTGDVGGGTDLSGVTVLEALSIRRLVGEIWSYSSRSLTQLPREVAESLASGTLVRYVATQWTIALTGLGSLTGATKVIWTAKKKAADSDNDAILQVDDVTGLVRQNKSSPGDPAAASLVVDDAANGDITVTVNDEVTATITPEELSYDVKAVFASGAILKAGPDAKLDVRAVITRAIS